MNTTTLLTGMSFALLPGAALAVHQAASAEASAPVVLATTSALPSALTLTLCEKGMIGVYLAATDEGAVIEGLVDGGPAERAGLKAGDMILAFGDWQVSDWSSLAERIGRRNAGERVSLIISSGDDVRSVELTLAAAPEAPGDSQDEDFSGGVFFEAEEGPMTLELLELGADTPSVRGGVLRHKGGALSFVNPGDSEHEVLIETLLGAGHGQSMGDGEAHVILKGRVNGELHMLGGDHDAPQGFTIHTTRSTGDSDGCCGGCTCDCTGGKAKSKSKHGQKTKNVILKRIGARGDGEEQFFDVTIGEGDSGGLWVTGSRGGPLIVPGGHTIELETGGKSGNVFWFGSHDDHDGHDDLPHGLRTQHEGQVRRNLAVPIHPGASHGGEDLGALRGELDSLRKELKELRQSLRRIQSSRRGGSR